VQPFDGERISAKVSTTTLAYVRKTTLFRTADNPRHVSVCEANSTGAKPSFFRPTREKRRHKKAPILIDAKNNLYIPM